MTLAVSVIVRPSQRLRCLQAGMSLSALLLPLPLFFAEFLPALLPALLPDSLPRWLPFDCWPWGVPLACLSAVAGVVALWQPPLMQRAGKRYRIDISGSGQIRLAVYLRADGAAAAAAAAVASAVSASAASDAAFDDAAVGDAAPLQTMALLPGAVCWPWLLVLPLRDATNHTVRLLVLPDSVAPGMFRPLAVACRACAAQHV